MFKVLSINMSAQGNFYAIDSLGRIKNEFQYQANSGQPFRITNARISTGFNFNSKKLFSKDKEDKVGEPDNTTSDIYGYYNFF